MATKRIGRELALVDALLIEVAHVDLDRCVVLGRDELVGPRAASPRVLLPGACASAMRAERTGMS